MTSDVGLVSSCDLVVASDHGQIYIYSPEGWDYDPDFNVYLEALGDAVDSDRFVGAARGLVDLKTPGQWNFQTPMRVEVWSGEPPDDLDDWDHEVDIDLDCPDGRIVFVASGGGPSHETDMPPGEYRMRVSGRGFGKERPGRNRDDSYRLRLWPREKRTEPDLRKRWPGWVRYSQPVTPPAEKGKSRPSSVDRQQEIRAWAAERGKRVIRRGRLPDDR